MRNAKVSATTAGLSDPSTSNVLLAFMIACPPSFGSTPVRTTRRRTRAPAGTGARKRALSVEAGRRVLGQNADLEAERRDHGEHQIAMRDRAAIRAFALGPL